VALALGLNTPAAAQQSGGDTPASYLFVFEGRDAKLGPKGGSSFELRMPIRRSNHLVTWFTDRPVRDAGHMSMSQFVGLWGVAGEDSFQSDPPNVAIELGQKTLIATMTDPRIESTKNGGKALVTKMTLVKGKALDKLQDSKRGIAAHAKRAGGNAHGGALDVKNVAVFVDVMAYESK
jgi:hypothetical protein